MINVTALIKFMSLSYFPLNVNGHTASIVTDQPTGSGGMRRP